MKEKNQDHQVNLFIRYQNLSLSKQNPIEIYF